MLPDRMSLQPFDSVCNSWELICDTDRSISDNAPSLSLPPSHPDKAVETKMSVYGLC